MMGRRIQMRQLTQIIALVVLGIFWGASVEAGAAEQRCNQLGANCACSEPLNTPTYTLAAGANWGWNPADSTTKECAIEGLAGAVYSIATLGINTKFGTNDSTILGALPAGHTNTYVLRGEDGYTGQWFLGHQFSTLAWLLILVSVQDEAICGMLAVVFNGWSLPWRDRDWRM